MGMELCPAHSWSSLIITITVSHEGACVCVQGRFLQIVIRTLCVLGVGMIMGDGVLTPAISVVSAIEGLGNIPGGGGNIPRSQFPQSQCSQPLPVLCISCRLLPAAVDSSPCWRPAALCSLPLHQLKPCACLTSPLRMCTAV